MQMLAFNGKNFLNLNLQKIFQKIFKIKNRIKQNFFIYFDKCCCPCSNPFSFKTDTVRVKK